MATDSKIETLQDLKRLIGAYEFIRLEFKGSQLFYDWKTQAPKKAEYVNTLSKEVSGLANTEGGYIVIGCETERVEKEPDKVIELDDGIAFKDFSPETIQRAVEASISPPLPGLRFIPIKTELDERRYYLAIEVPKGSTAHQAKDRIYYGRSEFETVPLHDSVVRLLMTRAMEPHAVVKLGDVESKGKKFGIGVYVENDGEIDIREFKLSLYVMDRDYRVWASPSGFDDNSKALFTRWITMAFRDGWPAPEGSALFKSGQRHSKPIMLNIYPRDRFLINRYRFSLLSLKKDLNFEDYVEDSLKTLEETLLEHGADPERVAQIIDEQRLSLERDPDQDKRFELLWKIFLPNTRPIEGSINLLSALRLLSDDLDEL